jgi:hypothetical protein
VTIENVTSTACATPRGVSDHFIPRSSSQFAFDLVRL